MFNFLTPYFKYLKIAALVFYTSFIWYAHGVYDDHKEVKIAQKEVTKAQAGETNLIKYQQEIKTVYVHDKCTDVPIPSATLQLLK